MYYLFNMAVTNADIAKKIDELNRANGLKQWLAVLIPPLFSIITVLIASYFSNKSMRTKIESDQKSNIESSRLSQTRDNKNFYNKLVIDKLEELSIELNDAFYDEFTDQLILLMRYYTTAKVLEEKGNLEEFKNKTIVSYNDNATKRLIHGSRCKILIPYANSEIRNSFNSLLMMSYSFCNGYSLACFNEITNKTDKSVDYENRTKFLEKMMRQMISDYNDLTTKIERQITDMVESLQTQID